jgi:hypothetical protein
MRRRQIMDMDVDEMKEEIRIAHRRQATEES